SSASSTGRSGSALAALAALPRLAGLASALGALAFEARLVLGAASSSSTAASVVVADSFGAERLRAGADAESVPAEPRAVRAVLFFPVSGDTDVLSVSVGIAAASRGLQIH